jgi:hypothetical protein
MCTHWPPFSLTSHCLVCYNYSGIQFICENPVCLFCCLFVLLYIALGNGITDPWHITALWPSRSNKHSYLLTSVCNSLTNIAYTISFYALKNLICRRISECHRLSVYKMHYTAQLTCKWRRGAITCLILPAQNIQRAEGVFQRDAFCRMVVLINGMFCCSSRAFLSTTQLHGFKLAFGTDKQA